MESKPKKYHWPTHSIADLFPAMTADEFSDLKKDMVERILAGLEALEHPIILLEDRILDGRHRDAAWMELAQEGACEGYFARTTPRFEMFDPGKHGTLAAWMRAKSANMVHRHIPADQKAAIFVKATEAFPEIKAALEEIKKENARKKKAGKPLDAGDQRGNTAAQIAKLAGVGPTTVKTVTKLKEEAPEKFEEVAQGKTSAKKAVQSLPKKSKKGKPGTKAKEEQVKGGKPKKEEVLGMVFRALKGCEDADTIKINKQAVCFQLRGHEVKVTCDIG
jgi:hypothetical protein